MYKIIALIGEADFFVTPCNTNEVGQIIGECRNMQIPYYVMGNGSNLLVSDSGYRGVIVQIYDKLNRIEWKENGAVVMAGCRRPCPRYIRAVC